jgi:hypothetical protein
MNMYHCPDDCGKKTFCFRGQPLPEDKTVCYTTSIYCDECGKAKFIMKDNHKVRIPHPKSTQQYWKGEVCECTNKESTVKVSKGTRPLYTQRRGQAPLVLRVMTLLRDHPGMATVEIATKFKLHTGDISFILHAYPGLFYMVNKCGRYAIWDLRPFKEWNFDYVV